MALVNEKQNIRYIDFFKAILMLLVVLGHINFANQPVKAWIYSFHMPAFFFASGMLVKNRPVVTPQSVCKLVEKKFRSLMIPYFVWALIYAPLEVPNLLRILYGSHQSLAGAGSLTSLWFLPVLFETFVMLFLIQLVLKDKFSLSFRLLLMIASFIVSAFLPTLRLGWPWGFNVSFSAFGFLILGNTLFPVIQRLHKAASETKRGLVFCILIMLLSFAGSFLYMLNIPEKGYIVMSDALYGIFPLFFMVAFMGTVFILMMSILLDQFLPSHSSGKVDMLSFLGQNTLCVFMVHRPIIKVFQMFFKVIPVPDALSLAATCLGTTLGSCLLVVLFNHFLPAVVGKDYERA